MRPERPYNVRTLSVQSESLSRESQPQDRKKPRRLGQGWSLRLEQAEGELVARLAFLLPLLEQ